MEAFRWVAESVMTAARVVSEPVPAVVGMAIRGTMGFRTRRIPCSCATVRLGWAIFAQMALAQSMGEPPPKATTALHPLSR